jgi:DNA-binding NarL/FixJ family response regulator
MNENELTVVLVDQPGRERDALRAMLAAMPVVQIIGVMDECLVFTDKLTISCPDVVIVKVRLMSKICVEKFKAQRQISPLPRYLVIADTMEQVKTFTANGIDKVLMTGFTNNELYEVLEQCLAEKVDKLPFPFNGLT